MVIVIVHPLNLLSKPASKLQNIFVNFDPNSCGQSKRTFQNIFLIFDISTDVNADDDDCDCDCPPQPHPIKWCFYAGSILESHKKDFFEADSYDDDDNDF